MWLLREHHEEIEADLGWDYMRRFYRGKVTPRQMLVRIKHLSVTSATVRAIDPDGTAWGVTDYLLAHVADVLAIANWQRGGDSHAKRPDPVKRPADLKRAAVRDQTIRERALAQRALKKAVSDG